MQLEPGHTAPTDAADTGLHPPDIPDLPPEQQRWAWGAAASATQVLPPLAGQAAYGLRAMLSDYRNFLDVADLPLATTAAFKSPRSLL